MTYWRECRRQRFVLMCSDSPVSPRTMFILDFCSGASNQCLVCRDMKEEVVDVCKACLTLKQKIRIMTSPHCPVALITNSHNSISFPFGLYSSQVHITKVRIVKHSPFYPLECFSLCLFCTNAQCNRWGVICSCYLTTLFVTFTPIILLRTSN